MEANENNWILGDIVRLPLRSEEVKKDGTTIYAHLLNSTYVCIRDFNGDQPGILVKALGKVSGRDILLIDGEPFYKDDKAEEFLGDHYFSFRFPKMAELGMALEIIRNNQKLMEQFEKARMPIHPDATFWVRDTSRNLLFQKKLKYYDSQAGYHFSSTNDNNVHHRLTIAYFTKSWVGTEVI